MSAVSTPAPVPPIPPSPPPLPSHYWLKWEKQIEKTAKVAGAIFLGIEIACISVVGGFPELFPIMAIPLVVVGAILVIGATSYFFYHQKVQKIKEDVTRQAVKLLYKNKGELSKEELENFKKITDYIEKFELNSSDLFQLRPDEIKSIEDIEPKSLKKLTNRERYRFLKNAALLFSKATTLELKYLHLNKRSSLNQFAELPLENLTFFDCEITDYMLTRFSEKCPKLKILSLSCCDKITEKGLKPFENNPIEEFTLDRCRLTTFSESPKKIFHDYLKTQEINCKSKAVSKFIKSENVEKKIEKFEEKLSKNRELIVDKKLDFEAISYEKLKTLERWKGLKKLSLTHVDDATVARLAQLPKLESLSILHSLSLTGSCFDALKDRGLQHLTIKPSRNFKKNSFAKICAMRKLKTVTFLAGAKNVITERTFQKFERHFTGSEQDKISMKGKWERD